jgi:para-nitrobenzyl esterase
MLLASSMPAVAQIPQTRVAQGELLGKREGEVSIYLGIPYAAPPVGANRWRPPLRAESWQGVRKADHFAASCQQPITPEGFGPWTREYVVSSGEVSENCLYLNIWTPARTSQDRLPVLFWIHGGGFSSGSGSVPIYDGARLASRGIVVVNVNYRLGVYGFLAHSELTAESPVHASGNYGLMDQAEALRWVRANIAAFGGDPNRVTIAGQSAGAASVHVLIASPRVKGLFAQAIAQSGSGMGIPVPGRTVAEATGRALSDVSNEKLSVRQLRNLTSSELDARVARMPPSGLLGLRFLPIVDGSFVPDASYVGMNTNDTPILTGMTANEITGLNPTFDQTTVADFNSQLTKTYGPLAPRFTALFPAKTDAEAVTAFESHARDRGLAATYFWAKDRLKHTRFPIYAYLWTHPEPGPEAARYKAFHSSEIPYVFDTLHAADRPFASSDDKLATTMSNYWLNFVKRGDPNANGLDRWPGFSLAGDSIMELGGSTKARPILAPDRIAAFEQYVKDGGQVGIF